MPDSMRYRLDDDRTILMDKLRGRLGIEKDRWRADVVDAALLHLFQSFENMDEARENLDPTTIQQFNTDVLALHYRTSVDVDRRVDLDVGHRKRR
jgi:hypothetical protein